MIRTNSDAPTRSESRRAAAIVERACIEFGVTEEEIVGRARRPWLTKTRGAIAQSLYVSGWSQLLIGGLIGGREPSTISTLITRTELRRRTDQEYDRQCQIVAATVPPAIPLAQLQDVTLAEMHDAVTGMIDTGRALLRGIESAQMATVTRVRRAS